MLTDQAMPNAATPYDAGVQLFQAGKIHDAISALRQATNRDPNNVRARFLLGVAFFRAKQFASCEEVLRTALARGMNRPEAYYYLGLALERQGDVGGAVQHYRLALAVDADFSEARAKLAQLAPSPAGPTAVSLASLGESPTTGDPKSSDQQGGQRDPDHIVGQVRGLKVNRGLTLGPSQVWTFRVERRDGVSNPLPPVPVEMQGSIMDGSISDGDRVEIAAKWRGGSVIRPRRLKNLTTGGVVSTRTSPLVHFIRFVGVAVSLVFATIIAIVARLWFF